MKGGLTVTTVIAILKLYKSLSHNSKSGGLYPNNHKQGVELTFTPRLIEIQMETCLMIG